MYKAPRKKEPVPEKGPIKEMEPKRPSEKETFEPKKPVKEPVKQPVKQPTQSVSKASETPRRAPAKASTSKGDTTYRKPPPKNATKQPMKSGGLYDQTKNVKDGGLRRALKVGDTHKFTVSQLQPLLKIENGKKFMFMGKEFVMDEKLRKQIQLAVNMMKN